MWEVLQSKYIKGTEFKEDIVWFGSRKKEAIGQCKHNLKSHIEVMLEHEHYEEFWLNTEIGEYFLIIKNDDGEILYSVEYNAVERKED